MLLKIRFYINPFDGIKIGDYLKVSSEFKDYDVDIANIKKTITYLTKMVEEMESINSKTVLSINDEVTILREPENTIFIDVNDDKTREEDTNEIIYQLLKNDDVNINFGSQIRSYFLEPYKLVKDHRTNYESPEPEKILNGDLKELLEYNLKHLR